MAPRKPATPRPSLRDHREAPSPATGSTGTPSEVAYEVPGKPVGQNRPGGRGKGGRRTSRVPHGVKTQDQRNFASALAFHGTRARAAAGWATTKEPVEVWIVVVLENERPDTDSPIKAILDSLEVSRPHMRRPGAGFVANDRQVRRYHVDRAIDRLRPRTEVTVRPWRPTAPVVEPVADWASAGEASDPRPPGEA